MRKSMHILCFLCMILFSIPAKSHAFSLTVLENVGSHSEYKEALKEHGYEYINWNVSAGDMEVRIAILPVKFTVL